MKQAGAVTVQLQAAQDYCVCVRLHLHADAGVTSTIFNYVSLLA